MSLTSVKHGPVYGMANGKRNPAVATLLRGNPKPRPSMSTRFKSETADAAVTSATNKQARNVLVAVDLTHGTDMAVDWAVSNLLRAGDSLQLLHLVPGASTDHLFSTPSGHMVRINDGMAETLEKQAHKSGTAKVEQLYKRYKPHLENMKVSLGAHVVPSPANKTSMGQTLCAQAETLDAAVVVVASHSHGGLNELIHGSVSNWAVKHCDRPVAVLHDPAGKHKPKGPEGIWSPPPAQPRQLLVAVDGSAASVASCQWIVDNMYRKGDTVHLVHVVPCLPLHAYMGDLWTSAGLESDPDLQLRQQEQAEREAKEWQESQALAFRSLLEKAGAQYTFDTAVLATEDPVQAISMFICSKADELQAAAVVLSHHEQSAFAEFFLGSVTSQVAHHCSQPVVVLHSARDKALQPSSV